MQLRKAAVGFWYIKDAKGNILGTYIKWSSAARRWHLLTGEKLSNED